MRIGSTEEPRTGVTAFGRDRRSGPDLSAALSVQYIGLEYHVTVTRYRPSA
jgi:hypothetical protein